MAKPTSGGAGGSGGRKRVAVLRNYTEPTAVESADIVRNGWENQKPQMGIETQAIVRNYEDGAWINSVIRGGDGAGEVGDSEGYPDTNAYIKALDSVVAPIGADTITYRGTRVPDLNAMYNELGANGMVGKVITDKAFLSTSFNRDVALEFARWNYSSDPDTTIIRIRTPKETRGFFTRGKGAVKEFVMDRKTSFRVVSIQKQDTKFILEVEAVQ